MIQQVMQNTQTQSPIEQVVAIARVLFAPEDIVETRLLPGGVSQWTKAGHLESRIERFIEANNSGVNIYFGANPRPRQGAKGDDCVQIARCLFADFDGGASVEQALHKIEKAGLDRPSVIVRSGHGVHCYWKLSEPITDLARWSEIQKDLIALLGTDPVIHNPERIMRLPGFINHKKSDGARCELVEADESRVYPELLRRIPSRQTQSITHSTTPAKVGNIVCEGGRNAALTSLAGSMRHRGMTNQVIVAALLAENRTRCNPPLPDDEVRAIGASVAKYMPAQEDDGVLDDGPAWPEPMDKAAYHGLAGEIVRKIEPHTEADIAALLVQFLIAFGNVIGRSAHFKVEGTMHHANLFAVLIGDTAKGRKGTSWGQTQRLFNAVSPSWVAERIVEGLSSGEGLIYNVRDRIMQRQPIKKAGRVVDYEDVEVDPGIDDKRLLVQEGEFAQPLKVMQRESNILSPILRRAWDANGKLKTLTKNNPVTATEAHISIIGHITKTELRKLIFGTETSNGFANRILWVCVRRSKLLPEGGAIENVDFSDLIAQLTNAIDCAQKTTLVCRDEDARAIWQNVYPQLTADRHGMFGNVTTRAEAQVMRIAMIYALLDGQSWIRPAHLRAALAVWEYCENSAKHVFGDALGDKIADEIEEALQGHSSGMTRTQIRNHFGGHKRRDQIESALRLLRGAQRAHSMVEQGAGRPIERWFAGLEGAH